MNDSNAKVLLEKDIYPDGANHPTTHIEYLCPCKKGKIVYENVRGFNDYFAIIECPKCAKNYDVVYGCGHIWELVKKD